MPVIFAGRLRFRFIRMQRGVGARDVFKFVVFYESRARECGKSCREILDQLNFSELMNSV